MATAEIDIFTCEPHTDLLSERSANEAYCTANPGAEYAVFFTDGGNVLLDVSDAAGKTLSVRWLDIRQCRWTGEATPVDLEADGKSLRLITPTEEGYWTTIVKEELP